MNLFKTMKENKLVNKEKFVILVDDDMYTGNMTYGDLIISLLNCICTVITDCAENKEDLKNICIDTIQKA